MGNMDAQMETLFLKLREEMKIQTKTLSETLSTTMDKKLKPLREENEKLKEEVGTLKTKVHILEKENRKNNLILHKVSEVETSNNDLLQLVVETLNKLSENASMEKWDIWEISKAQRLGKKGDRPRPILVTVTLTWRKIEVLKNNKQFHDNIYATEDFPKEILMRRKELKEKMKQELENGKKAYIRYDKLIVKDVPSGNETPKEKRKRSPTQSPNNAQGSSENPTEALEKKQPSKKNKVDAYALMRSNTKQ
ncbi:uncharacterized protein LOC134748878 [Cydia strobilella]|uniref:uncharacterized protein LOC134748878 n=1 Tax=Cydia strobilella TaxID=1100964 RepID=UPI003007498F